VCSTAQVLSALGVRVEVHAPAVAWPRGGAGRLVVSNRVSRLDGLALLTAVPGSPVVTAEIAGRPVAGLLLRRAGAVVLDRGRPHALPGVVADVAERLRRGEAVLVHPERTTACGARLDRFRPALFQAAVDAAAPVCPVAIRYRTGAGQVPGNSSLRGLRRIVALRDLVVEVHLLPALEAARADRRTLAALAEYAVAEVVEARPPAGDRPPAPGGSRPDHRVAAALEGR
jgi:1-acyl-sn-glycerol-3-phosphate acyltransferase